MIHTTHNGGKIKIKSKYDWFDDNWNPDVKLSTIIHELLLSPTYRWPMRVNKVHIYKDEAAYAPCPRCKGIIEYQFSAAGAGSVSTSLNLMTPKKCT